MFSTVSDKCAKRGKKPELKKCRKGHIFSPTPLSLSPSAELYGLSFQGLVYSKLGVENLSVYTPLALSTPCAGKPPMLSLGECPAKKEKENSRKHSRKVDFSYFVK